LARSTAYYIPKAVSPEDLVLMRWIEELHLQHPFAGARMPRELLRQQVFRRSRKRVGSAFLPVEISPCA
jgi:putative transposase